MLLLSVGVIALGRLGESKNVAWRPGNLSLHIPLMILVVVTFAAAFWLNSPWLGYLSFVSSLLLLGRNVPNLASSILLLLILLPLPFSFDSEVVHSLQRISSRGASSLMDAVGIRHLMAGNVLEVADRRFFVEEACSGIGSVFLLLSSAAVYAAWKQLRLIVTVPLLCAAVGWAVAANTFRIFVVAWAHVERGIDLSAGIYHDGLGSLTYLLALLLLILTEQFLLFIFDPISNIASDDRDFFSASEVISGEMTTLWNRITNGDPALMQQRFLEKGVSGILMNRSGMLAMLAFIFAIGGIGNGWKVWRASQPVRELSVTRSIISAPAAWPRIESDLFSQANAMEQLLGFYEESQDALATESGNATYAKSWNLQIAGTTVTFRLQGPFNDWQDSSETFENNEWKILESDVWPVPRLLGGNSIISEYILHKEGQNFTHFMNACFRTTAAPVVVSSNGRLSEVIDSQVKNRIQLAAPEIPNSVWQFQLQIDTDKMPEATARAFWRECFVEHFQILLQRWRTAL